MCKQIAVPRKCLHDFKKFRLELYCHIRGLWCRAVCVTNSTALPSTVPLPNGFGMGRTQCKGAAPPPPSSLPSPRQGVEGVLLGVLNLRSFTTSPSPSAPPAPSSPSLQMMQ